MSLVTFPPSESWTLAPITRLARRAIARAAHDDVFAIAKKTWVVAPSEAARTPPAIALPGQLDRVTGWAFGPETDQRRSLAGRDVVHGETRACLVEDAVLVDGTLHAGSAARWLLPRTGRVPSLRIDHEVERASMFATANGNRWFGMWLIDDCTAYPLAAAEAPPVTTTHAISAHAHAYEEWLGMTPTRLASARFRELVLFDDVGHNRSKRERFAANRAALRARVQSTPHPGTFLLRGLAGDRRLLENELELAELLRERHGFTVIDPMRADLPEILGSCAGARTVVGVEGSALAHGLAVLSPGANLLILQPPDRFCSVYKDLTDRDGQRFAYVVGTPSESSFRVDPDELLRTLDLLK